MVRNYKRKTNRGTWDEDDMRRAVRAVLSETMRFLRASATYVVPKSTLERRVRKARCAQDADTDSDNDYGKKTFGRFKTVFNKEQEEELSQYIKSMEARLFGITSKELRILALLLDKKRPDHKKTEKKRPEKKKPEKINKNKRRRKESDTSSSEDDENDCPCIYCGYLYSQSNEGWVICRECQGWAHNSCAGVDEEDEDAHICERCRPD